MLTNKVCRIFPRTIKKRKSVRRCNGMMRDNIICRMFCSKLTGLADNWNAYRNGRSDVLGCMAEYLPLQTRDNAEM